MRKYVIRRKGEYTDDEKEGISRHTTYLPVALVYLTTIVHVVRTYIVHVTTRDVLCPLDRTFCKLMIDNECY